MCRKTAQAAARGRVPRRRTRRQLPESRTRAAPTLCMQQPGGGGRRTTRCCARFGTTAPARAGSTLTIFLFTRSFPTARRSVRYDSPTASYYYVRCRLRAAGAWRLGASSAARSSTRSSPGRRRWDGWPRPLQGCACNGELDRDRQGSPPTSRPPRGRGATHSGRCAESSEADEVANEVLRCCIPAAPDFRAEHQQLLRAATRELRVRAVLAPLRDLYSAAPSTSTVHGCGCPVLVHDGRHQCCVAAQCPAIGSGAVTTRSRRRRSSVGMPLAVVWASHCCGTTWPSAPTASRATRTQARSTTFAHLADKPVREQAGAWSPKGAGAAAAGANRQGQAKASPERNLHGLWRAAVSHAPACGPAWERSSARELGGKESRSKQSRECTVRVRDAWYCQPCGQSPAPEAAGGAGRAPSSSIRHVGQSLQPWSCKVRRAFAASARQCAPSPAPDSRRRT